MDVEQPITVMQLRSWTTKSSFATAVGYIFITTALVRSFKRSKFKGHSAGVGQRGIFQRVISKKISCEKVPSLLMWQFHSENSGGLASCYTSYMLICGLKCVASAELTEKISSYNLHINTYSYV